jgi:hypothetical protein
VPAQLRRRRALPSLYLGEARHPGAAGHVLSQEQRAADRQGPSGRIIAKILKRWSLTSSKSSRSRFSMYPRTSGSWSPAGASCFPRNKRGGAGSVNPSRFAVNGDGRGVDRLLGFTPPACRSSLPPKRQDADRGGGEARALAERAKAVAEVLPHRAHGAYSTVSTGFALSRAPVLRIWQRSSS